jgi:hypothetical protein
VKNQERNSKEYEKLKNRVKIAKNSVKKRNYAKKYWEIA